MSNFDWMNEAIYEPRPTLHSDPAGPSRGWRVFWILAALVVVCGGLAGLA